MSSDASPRNDTSNGRRSNSLVGGFIKRTKSNDLLGERKSSGNFLRTKLPEEDSGQTLLSKEARLPPPRLPSFTPQPSLQTFGGENYVPVSSPIAMNQSAASALPAGVAKVDPHARTESMTHRGRYSYAPSTISSLNSPRRVRRRKDPTTYNVLVIGARGSGKTSFINFLKSTIPLPSDQESARNPELDMPPPSARTNRGTFVQHYQEIEIDNERIGLSVWDSEGFDKNLIDLQLRDTTNFVESKFEDTFIEEMKVVRAPGYRDTHIHCVFLIMDPAKLDANIQAGQPSVNGAATSIYKPARIAGALDEDFELQILKNLQGKTTVIPVISKADTVTTTRMAYLKKRVWEGLKQAGLDPLEALHIGSSDSDDDIDEENEDEMEDEGKVEMPVESGLDKAAEQKDGDNSTSTDVGTDPTAPSPKVEQGESVAAEENPIEQVQPPVTQKREPSNSSVTAAMFNKGYVPLSILSPDDDSLGGQGSVGRKFPWGFADPHNPEHCDFDKLKEACFSEWRLVLREASREVFYERWRTGRLNRGTAVSAPTAKSTLPPVRKSSGIPIDLSSGRNTRY